MILQIKTPVLEIPENFTVGEKIEISGIIYTARDAVMPKLKKAIESRSPGDLPVSLKGAAVMHTAFSPAGFGPTSSNKHEIESTMGILSEAGVKIHLGKGAIKKETVNEISKHGSIFVVVPPVSALLQSRVISKRVAAFAEEGIEALHELEVNRIPGIIAAANGISIFDQIKQRNKDAG